MLQIILTKFQYTRSIYQNHLYFHILVVKKLNAQNNITLILRTLNTKQIFNNMYCTLKTGYRTMLREIKGDLKNWRDTLMDSETQYG